MTKQFPNRIDLDQKQIDALLKRVKNQKLEQGDYEIIKGLIDTLKFLGQAVDQKAASIKRLLRMIFGESSEKKKNLIQNEQTGSEDKGSSNSSLKIKGHGRNSKDEYTGATTCKVPHESLKPGDACPKCGQGKVYLKEPETIVRITAIAPLTATKYELEKFRCNLCLQIFTAKVPEEAGPEKYDETARSMIALLKYGSGFPFHRLQKLQDSLGIPLPATTQWDQVKQTGIQIFPAFDELIRQAAQGEVIHNDDTTMKIQQLIKENQEKSPDRTGMFTTGIVSVLDDRQIAIFATGRKHAGENLDDILTKRDQDLPPPIHMCDALSRNIPKSLQTLLAHCLTHGRRNFVDVLDNFPEACRYVIEQLAVVYKNDELTKEQKMSAQERLEFHQQESGPVMEELQAWCSVQLEENIVEPNSGLGKAITYMLKHWMPLTLFLRESGAPLDNNICERILKKSILHRKNSLFYRTLHGARIGDLFMSLIHTCNLNRANPFDYLTELQKNFKEMSEAPQNWMPWNYKKNLLNR